MIRHGYPFAFSVFVDLMASTLADEGKTHLLQDFDYFTRGGSREFLAHTATSNEVKLIDSM